MRSRRLRPTPHPVPNPLSRRGQEPGRHPVVSGGRGGVLGDRATLRQLKDEPPSPNLPEGASPLQVASREDTPNPGLFPFPQKMGAPVKPPLLQKSLAGKALGEKETQDTLGWTPGAGVWGLQVGVWRGVVVEPGPRGLLTRPHPHLQPQAAEPGTFAKLFAVAIADSVNPRPRVAFSPSGLGTTAHHA